MDIQARLQRDSLISLLTGLLVLLGVMLILSATVAMVALSIGAN